WHISSKYYLAFPSMHEKDIDSYFEAALRGSRCPLWAIKPEQLPLISTVISFPDARTVRSAPGLSLHPLASYLPLGRRRAEESAARSPALSRLSRRYGSASA